MANPFKKTVDDVVAVFTKAISDLEKVKDNAVKENEVLESKIAKLEVVWKENHEEHLRANKVIANLKKVLDL